MIGRRLFLGALFVAVVAAPSPAFVAEVPLFQFVQISDTHIRAAGVDLNREATLNSIIDKINAMPQLPAFVLVTGDLTESGLVSEYQNFKNIMARLNPAVARHYTPGNHETMTGTWADYVAQIGPLYKSFTVSNCLFILTNGTRDDAPNYHEDGFIDSTQLQWIQTQLQGAGSMTHVVMANHYPLGTQWGLYSVIDPALSTLRGWMRDFKVTAWLNGHRHFDGFFADTAYQTSHILCGVTTGYNNNAGPGYRLNSVYSDRIVSDRIPVYAVPNPSFVEPAGPYVCPNPRSVAPPPPANIPAPDRVVVVIEENKAYSQIIGSASAPYINSLAAQGALFTNSYALTHPSQPNYIMLFSGANQGCVDSTCPAPGSPYTTPNLGAALLAKGLTFGGYSEDLPAIGSTVCNNLQYWRKHNPWVNWQGTGTNQLPASVNLRYLDFPTSYAGLPTLSFVIPNQDHDMHDGATPVATGDAWLQTHLDPYVQWAKTHNSLFILTFDEDDGSEGNRVVTIFVGPMVKPGQYSNSITHYNLLRTLEDMYGLTHSGAAAAATPITNVWQTAAPTISAQPASQAVVAGQTATFTVGASGTAPLAYQWQKNGSAIGGATAASYTTPATTLSDNGATFRCVVTNSAGSATSSSATLSVTSSAPPNVLANPGFEQGGQGWSGINGASTAVEGSAVHSGSMALRISGSKIASPLVQQSVAAAGGKNYTASAWVKVDALQRGAKVRVAWRNAVGSTLRTDLVQTTVKGTQNWMQVSALLSSPAGTTQAFFQLMVAKEGDGAGTAWFDDLSLVDPPYVNVPWLQDPEDLDGDGLLNDFEVEQSLDPAVADTGATGMSDDQKTIPSGWTYEQVQSGAATVPAPSPSGGSGGSGGACGALGIEGLLLLALRRRRRAA